METTANHEITTTEDGSFVARLQDAEVFFTPSDSTDRIHMVVIAPDTRPHCTGFRPPCRAGRCKHIRRVLEAKAGF